jgi:diguanylate cyclase (GGDEF)-like protein
MELEQIGMKVGKGERRGRPAKAAGTRGAAGSAKVTIPIIAPTTPSASVLGIPDAEFTPCVRDAVATLMHEVERLRQEIDQTRTRLEDLARAADQDMLLPILNRRAFVREISRFIAFAERYGIPSSLLYFDLNDFKAVNDAYGHSAGDSVLRHFAELLGSQIRDSDILARIGGDEFAIILAHVTLDQASKKGESLSQSLRDHPPVWNGEVVNLSFSCGTYELRVDTSPDAAIAHADRAMYAQKRNAEKFKR